MKDKKDIKFFKFEIPVSDELTLKLMDSNHAGDMFIVTQRNKAFLSEWLAWANKVKSPQDSLNKIAEDHTKFGDITGLELGIFLQGKFIGRIGFHSIKGTNAEVGYWLDQEHNGKGIITGCLKVLIKHAFTETNLHRIVIKMDIANVRSRKVPDRCGFTYEGIERESMLFKGEFRSSFVYSLLKTDKINF